MTVSAREENKAETGEETRREDGVVGGARRGRGGVSQKLWCDKPSSLL